jgi:hypothetical protein
MTHSPYTQKFDYPSLDWEHYVERIESRRTDPIPDDADTEHMYHVISGEWFSQEELKW